MANIDVEMGQFPIKTTMANSDYVVISLADGSQGQIKVSDIASVVAAVLGNPLGYKNTISKGTNLDSITSDGYYMLYKTTQEDKSPVEEGCLIVMNVSFFFIQIVIGNSPIGIYARFKWGSASIGSWNKFA